MRAKRMMAALAVGAAMVAAAEPSGERPNATHAWAVHDVNRPDPVRVATPPGRRGGALRRHGGERDEELVCFGRQAHEVDREER